MLSKYLFIPVLFLFSYSAWAIEFDLLATQPTCIYSNHKSTFCRQVDAGKNAEISGLEKRVVEIIGKAVDVEKSFIAIAYFSFSNPVVFEALCEKGKSGIKIKGYFDTSYAKENQMPQKLKKDCQGPSGQNVSVAFLGTPKGKSSWRIHHHKFLYVDNGSSDIWLNYSSGNLSSYGLSNHLDHWLMMSAAKETRLVKTYDCMIRSMNVATAELNQESDDPKKYQAELQTCFQEKGLAGNLAADDIFVRVENELAQEEIASLLSPSRQSIAYQVLKKQIDSVANDGEILGGTQHFLHRGLAADLRNAAARGVRVVLLMDDDVFLGTSGVPQARKFFFNELVDKGMEIRLMDTNNMDEGGFEPPQMMHHKFLIMKGVQTAQGRKDRVFSGAGQFTNAAMKTNYENFGLLENTSIVKKYEDLFQWLNVRSMRMDDPILNGKRRPKPKP